MAVDGATPSGAAAGPQTTHNSSSSGSSGSESTNDPPTPTPTPARLRITDRAALRAALARRPARPVLTHLNADTTWLLQLPYPSHPSHPADSAGAEAETGAGGRRDHNRRRRRRDRRSGRRFFNLLLDPWLSGPQSDVAGWFSTQWHVEAPGVGSVAELDEVLRDVEGGGSGSESEDDGGEGEGEGEGDGSRSRSSSSEDTEEKEEEEEEEKEKEKEARRSYIDAVVISHEFTDHCHEATLRTVPRAVPVFAPDKAAALVRSWRHFDTVVTTPALTPGCADWRAALLGRSAPPGALPVLPDWVGVGRVVTAGNALYYHSAVVVAFETTTTKNEQQESGGAAGGGGGGGGGQAVVYSPHGIRADDLAATFSAPPGGGGGPGPGLDVLALLHGLHDVRIWGAKQLNLGAAAGLAGVRATGARYWVATHDEVKRGGGLIAPLLRRRRYTLADAVAEETKKAGGGGGGDASLKYDFVELGSGDGLVLA
ncbi:hypothetical protein GGR56DRAFT_669361 [Xylariaceae sp. FL0804]|nr:hypothetical protein GGR56DRAFT_669361 [Xylariaceae sp. FL0804]